MCMEIPNGGRVLLLLLFIVLSEEHQHRSRLNGPDYGKQCIG